MRLGPHTIDGNKLQLKVVRIKEEKEELVSSTDDSPPSPAACEQLSISNAQLSAREIFVGGLRPGINEHNLREYFSESDNIREFMIILQSKGLSKNNIINGRTLCVRIAVPKEKLGCQQQDIENDPFNSGNRNHKTISQPSSRRIGPIRRSRK